MSKFFDLEALCEDATGEDDSVSSENSFDKEFIDDAETVSVASDSSSDHSPIYKQNRIIHSDDENDSKRIPVVTQSSTTPTKSLKIVLPIQQTAAQRKKTLQLPKVVLKPIGHPLYPEHGWSITITKSKGDIHLSVLDSMEAFIKDKCTKGNFFSLFHLISIH